MSAPIVPDQKWFVIRDGVRSALLEHPRQEDMFWFSYEVTALPEARESVYALEFWRDVFAVEEASSGIRVERVFAGNVQPRAFGERLAARLRSLSRGACAAAAVVGEAAVVAIATGYTRRLIGDHVAEYSDDTLGHPKKTGQWRTNRQNRPVARGVIEPILGNQAGRS